MIWIYRILAPLFFLFALPFYLRRMWMRGGYDGSFSQRLGRRLNLPPRQPGKLRVWVQAVSVGEIGGIEPLLRELSRDGDVEFVLTTTTVTGHSLALNRMGDLCAWIGWFPIDFASFNRRFWNAVRPDVVFLMESELWPEHLLQASKRNVPVYLVNARLSDRSFKRFQLVASMARDLAFRHLTLVLAASPLDADRFRALDPSLRVERTGNLKLDLPMIDAEVRRAKRQTLIREFGFQHDGTPSTEPVVLFGNSTWPGEEQMLAEVLEQSREAGHECRLVIVPRHAETREEIRKVLQTSGLPFHFRSDGPQAPAGTVVYVGDTTGELYNMLHAADVVFVGKSLPPHAGGQNPIEAVSLGLPIVFGPRMSNFRTIATSLAGAGVAKETFNAAECRQVLSMLVTNKRARSECSAAAIKWLEQNQGALRRTAAVLRAELKKLTSR